MLRPTRTSRLRAEGWNVKVLTVPLPALTDRPILRLKLKHHSRRRSPMARYAVRSLLGEALG